MLRKFLSAALALAAACSGSPAQLAGPTLPSPNAPPPVDPVLSAPARPAPPPRPAVTSDPDTPAGAEAARDAELAAKVTPFVDAFLNSAGQLTADGKRVVVSSNRDGIDALYVADPARPDSPATRLAELKERTGAYTISPDGKTVVFRTDKGADENWTLFRVGIDGKGLTELTPGEVLNRDAAKFAAKKPDTIFYSARKKEESTSSVYTLPLAGGGTPKRLYGSEGYGALGDVAPDARTMLYLRLPAPVDAHLDIIDVATGKGHELYPGSAGGKVSILDASLSADGKRAFVCTDTGGENHVLLALDTTTGKEVGRYVDPAGPTASIEGCAFTRKRNRMACGVIVGNHNEVRILDAATLKPLTEVKMPLGSGRPDWFSDDGNQVIVDWSTPNNPRDLYVVSVKTGEVKPLRKEPRPSIAGLPPLEVTTAEVTAHDGLKIPVQAYLPPGAAAGKTIPVIVNYHGGPASVSMIGWSARVRFFTSLGYAWVEPNVRGSSGYGRAYVTADDGPKRPDALKDIQSTGRWVAEQPWADKSRLVIFGGSYGGYSVLVGLTRYPELWRAGVDLVGVVNWISFMKNTNGTIRELFLTEIGDPEKDKALLESLSPINDIDKIKVPLFVYAGANDPRVPRTEDDQVVKALRERGVPVEYMVAADEGHSLSRRDTQITFAARAARFLEKALAEPAK